MAKYVCLLRGINVSGHKMMKMDRLRACLESLGQKDVKTYLQSGNVVFAASDTTAKKLVAQIGEKTLQEFGFAVPVIVLTAKEIEATLKGNPFLNEKEIDPAKLHVTFLSAPPTKAALEKLALVKSPPDRYAEIGQRIYLDCPNGYGNTKLSNQTLERVLRVEATTRNWKTVNEMCRMIADQGLAWENQVSTSRKVPVFKS